MNTELLLQQSKDLITNLTTALEETNKKLIEVVKENHELTEQNKTFTRITDADEWYDGKEIAKALNYKGYGRNTIYALLRDKNIFDGANQPYQKFVNAGYFKIVVKENEVNGKFYNVPLVSAKGIDYVRRIIDEHISTDTNEL